MSMKDLVGGVADCDDGNALRQFAGHMQRERPIQRVFSHFLNRFFCSNFYLVFLIQTYQFKY